MLIDDLIAAADGMYDASLMMLVTRSHEYSLRIL